MANDDVVTRAEMKVDHEMVDKAERANRKPKHKGAISRGDPKKRAETGARRLQQVTAAADNDDYGTDNVMYVQSMGTIWGPR